MDKKEKIFYVMSREDSKKFADEYLQDKIGTNYQLIPGFELNPVIDEEIVVENNDYPNNNAFNSIDEQNSSPSYVLDTNLDSNQNNNSQNYEILENQESNLENCQNENKIYEQVHSNHYDESTQNNYFDANELNSNNLSSSYSYNDDTNIQNFNDDKYLNFSNNSNNYLENTFNFNEKSKYEKLIDNDYEINTAESENLQNLLNDYNMNKNILSENNDFDDDTFFSYLSKKKIKTIISEKLGYCDEEMLDEIHTKAISENWKELDVQKWLLNPENINRFKKVNYNEHSKNDLLVNFSSSEIDKSLFDLPSENLVESINKINKKDNYDDNSRKISDLKESIEKLTEDFKKENLKNLQHQHDKNHHECKDHRKDKHNNVMLEKNNHFKHDINFLDKSNFLCDCKKNSEQKSQEKIMVNEIKSNQKLLEKEISNKFDLLNSQIQNINGNFKATLVDESYRKLLFDNQTETIKNYLNEKLLNSHLFLNLKPLSKITEIDSCSKINNQVDSNFNTKIQKNRNQLFKKTNNQFNKSTQINGAIQAQKKLNLKIDELNKKLNSEINEINFNLSKWEENSVNNFNNLKTIVTEILTKIDSNNNNNNQISLKEDKDNEDFFNKLKNINDFTEEYISTKEENNKINESKNNEEIVFLFENEKLEKEIDKKKNETNVEIVINPINLYSKSYDEENFYFQEKNKEFFKNRINDDFFVFDENKETTKINFSETIVELNLEQNSENSDEEILEFKKINESKIEIEEEKEIFCKEILVLKDFKLINHEFKNDFFIGVNQISDTEFYESFVFKKNKEYIPTEEELYKITEKDHQDNQINADFLYELFNGPEYVEPVKKTKSKEKFISLKLKNQSPTKEELYKITEKDHQDNQINADFLYELFNGPEYVEPVKKIKSKEKFISLKLKNQSPTKEELYKATEKDHQDNQINADFLYELFNGPEYVESEKKILTNNSLGNFNDESIAEKVNDINENFNNEEYEIFENKKEVENSINLTDINELISNDDFSLLNSTDENIFLNNNYVKNDEFDSIESFTSNNNDEINLNLEDLSDKEILEDLSDKNINEFFSINTDNDTYLDKHVDETIDLNLTENKNEINDNNSIIDLENIVKTNSENSSQVNITNEKESQNLKNNNYNTTLDKLKKERLEKVNKELIDNSEKFISNIKENVINELDEVIKGLEDLNINDDSIYDIENIKIKFKNI